MIFSITTYRRATGISGVGRHRMTQFGGANSFEWLCGTPPARYRRLPVHLRTDVCFLI